MLNRCRGICVNALVEFRPKCLDLVDLVKGSMNYFSISLDRSDQMLDEASKRLNELVRKGEPERAVDRLLVACLIEARSCERFDLLRQHAPDAELRNFYGSLFASEARHHSTYARLATTFADKSVVEQRLDELADAEAEIIGEGEAAPRMHS